jgi:two-component system OmpR family response regulator
VSHVNTLHVDDNCTVIEAMRLCLASSTDLTYHITACQTLAAAQRELSSTSYDLVLLDLTLPNGAGIDLIHRVRELALGAALVVYTGDDSEETAIKACAEGVQEYIVKGTAESEVLRRLRRAIATHRSPSMIKVYADRVNRSLANQFSDTLTCIKENENVKIVSDPNKMDSDKQTDTVLEPKRK